MPPVIVPNRRHRGRRRAAAAAIAVVALAAVVAAWWASSHGGPFATVPRIALPGPDDGTAAPARAAAPADPASPATIVASRQSPPVAAAAAPSTTRSSAEAAASLPVAASASTPPLAASAAPAPAEPREASSTGTQTAAADAPAGDLSPSTPSPPASATMDGRPTTREGAAEADLDASAAELMREQIPRVAQAAERQLGRVLVVAASASEFRRRSDVRNAAQAMRMAAPRPALPALIVHEAEARRLNEAARVAYWQDGDVGRAARLQARAFAANPFDSEIVGNLAFLRLRQEPPDAETARQLALHSLTLHDPRFPSGRIEDWTAFAIASALTGHDVDARNAWFASMALASDLQHQCSNAVRSESIYGDRLRPSVQAMLQRARSSAAYGRCEAVLAPRAGRPARTGPGRARSPARRGKANPSYLRSRMLGQ